MTINFKKINHIQICIPINEEQKGREFYCGILGLEEIKRPESLKNMGGFWLKIANITLHIGTEKLALEGKSKRHPAFEVDDLQSIKQHLQNNNIKITEDIKIPGIHRFSFYDPWKNRIELIELN